ncbi:MAG: hypothetical protein QNJ23_03405 [Woeseiaceae bacterium]|nr:hypothetical protein [Woeseiaceae bacterium]
MAIDWLGVPAALIAWGFALYVFIVAPSTRGSRYLVAMLVIDGIALMSSYTNWRFVDGLLTDFGLVMLPWGEIHQASDWALVAVYLPFLGMTLDSALVAPLRNPIVRNAVLYGGLAIALSMFVLPIEIREAFRVPFYVVICVVLTWGFAAAVHSWFTATTEAKRERARAFTMAFGIRDIFWTVSFGLIVVYFYAVLSDDANGVPDLSHSLLLSARFLYEVGLILFVPLIAYGVLRVQLFDIDLRIKRSLKRSTVAAAFVATFFVVSELAGNFLSNQLGAVLGVLMTGGLVFFLDPIQRAAERLSDAAMPNTHDTPEYASYRKLQVYENAVQAALEDGHISDRQRRVLNSMIKSMGIDPSVAEQLETDARAAIAS